jgi:hypothetical protein
MESEIFLGVILLFVGGVFWSFIKLYQFSRGRHSDYLYLPPATFWCCLLGIWFPFFSVLVIGYILIVCKSAAKLMTIRSETVKHLKPEQIVDITSEYIVDHHLTNDEWVLSTWNKSSAEEWTKTLAKNQLFLEQALDKNLVIHVSEGMPYAEWTNVIKTYVHLQTSHELNSAASNESET